MKSQQKHTTSDGFLKRALRLIIPLGVSAVLIVWLLHKVNIGQITSIMSRGVDYRFIATMMCLTVMSHIIRGIRWGMQLRAVGVPRMTVTAESVSIFGAYALDLVVPFMGEAWRCVYVSRRERVKLSTVVGTDIGDRMSDLAVILMLLGVTLIVAGPQIHLFLSRYALGRTLEDIASDGTMWMIVAAVVVLTAVAAYLFRDTRFMQGVRQSLQRIAKGFDVLFYLKDWWLYIILTFGIWTCYFLETYSCFYAFDFTRELVTTPGMAYGLLPGLVVFVFGSCSMAVPSNGGLGPWNVAVMFALSLYGISDADGASYSIICWSFQAATYVLLGIFCAIYITRHRTPLRAPLDRKTAKQ